ncbi:SusC/RagA family TonB-linked outer membrane protein [Flavobacterium sp. GT3P67]|uniref:SusC/RagA family TonB-linked outer membrane protein n=1 Tax=Flavobacterium sp. GT3P67 TaxID=2541722 RepID=UPI00104956C7|nr:SusC/RagA family TonB-linked outer membrane protein [Flavobacterium sp. GT3P67]TDE54286.1 SusC/RagA family TonB-linked outer membrane protein [Flavobacterium sp. GT3P67]
MRSKFKWIFSLLLALSMQFAFAQEKTVAGVVTDATGPLPGVNVLIKGTKTGVQTDFDGKYSIKAKTGDVLVFSFVGMTETTKTVGASNTVNVTMKDGVSLNEVIVQTNLGYFSRDSKKLSSSISTVSAEEIEKQSPALTIQNALQGQAAGVQVTGANGKPGAAAFVTVRGAVSITGGSAQAIYVVDGAFVSGTEASALSANDVESVSVLKDGASAAIYGVRGGNGVIVITTKKGKNAKAKFTFNNTIGFSQKIKDPFTMMNADDKIRYEGLIGVGGSIGKTPAQVALLRSYNHNWQDDLLRKGFIQNNNFSYSGGNDQFTNYMSVGYTEDTGIIDKLKGFNRITARYNSEYKANESVKFGFNIGGSYEKFNDSRDRNNAQSPIRAMYDYNPYEPFYARDANGNIINDVLGNPTFNTNLAAGFPIQEAIINNTEQRRFFRLYGRPYVEIGIVKDLKFKTQMNMNYERYQRESFTKPGSFLDLIVGDPAARGSKTDNGSDALEYQLTNSLTYKYSINNKHNFDATVLYEYFKSNFRSYSLTRKGYVNGDLPTAGTAVVGVPSTGRTENAQVSMFGNINYDFDGKYLVSLYGRRDGSSVLGANNKYEFAKGASIGWNVTRESFMSNVKWLNNLKLRASYGELNSTNGIGSYDAQNLFSTSPYGGGIGTILTNSTVGNPNLKFEKARKSEIGLESALFNNWLTFSSSVFKDVRKDFIYSDNTTDGAAFGTQINAGDWTSKGAEVELKAFAIKSASTTLSFYVNAAVFDRKINTLNRPGDPNNQLSRGLTWNKVGHSPDDFFLVNYAGVDPANGHALYTKLDGTTTDVYSAGDRVFTGKTPYAKYEGGFGMQFAYKGFDLSTDFVFKQGNYTYNYMWSNMNADGNAPTRNQAVNAFDYWTSSNTTASRPVPRQISGINSNVESDRYLEDASFIRFRNLNVGYKFTKKAFNNLPVDDIRFYVQMQNLFTWTKFNGDPEVGIGSAESQTGLLVPGQFALYSYPTVQSFLFGLSINL